MNTVQLECFLAVADNLSFARAAEQLHITQPAVTHQISSLENELNVKLFRRTTRTVALTKDFLWLCTYHLKNNRSGKSKAFRPIRRPDSELFHWLSHSF